MIRLKPVGGSPSPTISMHPRRVLVSSSGESKKTTKSALLTPVAFIILTTLVLSSSLYAGLTTCAGAYNLGNSGSAPLGCEQVDKEFNNFSYSSAGPIPEPSSSVPVATGTIPTSAIGATFGSLDTWSASSPYTTSAIAPYAVTLDPAYGTEMVCFYDGASSCAAVGGNAVNFGASIYTASFTAISFASPASFYTSGNNFFGPTDDFFDTPEPATFGLMAAALAGLSLFGLRKRA